MVVYSHDWILVGLGVFAIVCFLGSIASDWLDKNEIQD